MDIINTISIYSAFIPLLIGFYTLKRGILLNSDKVILLFVFISLSSDFISMLLIEWFNNNIIWINVYQLAETTLISLWFVSIMPKHVVIRIIVGLTILFTIINNLVINSIYQFSMVGILTKSTALIICCLVYFFTIFREEKVIYIEKTSSFWFNSALLIYFSGSLFTFLTYDLIKTWSFHNICNTLKNLLIAVGYVAIALSHRND